MVHVYALIALRGRATPILSVDYTEGDDGGRIPIGYGRLPLQELEDY